MAEFTENALARKLQELDSSQQGIQTLSLWLIYHRKHHGVVVNTWFKELLKIKDCRQLTFMYLANDVIQHSIKKGPEYGQEFGKVLAESFRHMAETGINTKTKDSLHRILNIWQEKGVYDAAKIQEFNEAVDSNNAVPATKTTTKRKSTEAEVPEVEEPYKKPKVEGQEPKHEQLHSETKTELDSVTETPTTPSPSTSSGDPPEAIALFKTLLQGTSVSNHEMLRECIASLPPEISADQLWSKLAGNIPLQSLLETQMSCLSDETVKKYFLSLPRDITDVQYFSKLCGKMTPYFRINAIIRIVLDMIMTKRLIELEKKRLQEILKLQAELDKLDEVIRRRGC